jgi:hypothetical protein
MFGTRQLGIIVRVLVIALGSTYLIFAVTTRARYLVHRYGTEKPCDLTIDHNPRLSELARAFQDCRPMYSRSFGSDTGGELAGGRYSFPHIYLLDSQADSSDDLHIQFEGGRLVRNLIRIIRYDTQTQAAEEAQRSHQYNKTYGRYLIEGDATRVDDAIALMERLQIAP